VIQFNLLPHREALRQYNEEQFKASMVLTLILGGITAFAVYGSLNSSIEAQKENIAVLEKEIKLYEAQIIEIKDLKAQIDALLARQKAVEDIQADRNSPVRLLSELANNLPQGVALTKLMQKNQELTLEGTAQTNENLSQFLDNLGKGGGWFYKPELQVSAAENLNPAGKSPINAFKFSLKVMFLRAQDPTLTAIRPAGVPPKHAASAVSPADAASQAPPGIPKA
jgi:type IV pilus assembly protein PilN